MVAAQAFAHSRDACIDCGPCQPFALDHAQRFAHRGARQPGLRADFNLIDPARLSVGMPQLVRDLPAGGKRFLQKAEGYIGTWVAGEAVVREGQITEARPGRLVRMGQGT